MSGIDYIFRALGFESGEKKSNKVAKKKTRATYKLKNGKAEDRVEQIDGIPVYYPENFVQAKEYAEFLKDKKAVIISMDLCDKEQKERILDFYNGVVSAIGAKLIVLDEGRLYLLLPEGCEVEE